MPHTLASSQREYERQIEDHISSEVLQSARHLARAAAINEKASSTCSLGFSYRDEACKTWMVVRMLCNEHGFNLDQIVFEARRERDGVVKDIAEGIFGSDHPVLATL